MRAVEVIQECDLSALIEFYQTSEDDNTYNIPKSEIKRLCEIGVVRSLGFGRYSVTSFGDYLVMEHFSQSPVLPLKTGADYDRN